MGRYGVRRRLSLRSLALAVAVVAVMPLIGGCGLLGGLSASRLATPAALTVISPEFGSDKPLPPQFTCHGAGLSPPLLWSGGLSSRPKSYAIVVDDGEAPITPFVYWIVFGISPNTTAIAQNQVPTGAKQALNSQGTARYDPPCPIGHNAHTYRFTVYALNASLNYLHNGAALRTTWSAIAQHVIAIGRLTAEAVR